jgi:osmotically-inducible protein OsmY
MRRGPKIARSDGRILEDVCDALMADGWVDATGIEVAVDDQDVTLTGEVAEREQKWRAEDVAESVLGVRAVINRIRVRRPGAPLTTRALDAPRPGNGHRA